MKKTILGLVILSAWLCADTAWADTASAPHSPSSVNIFTESDAGALDKVEKAALSLQGDIFQSAGVVNQPNDFDLKQVDCLQGLGDTLDEILSILDAESDLVHLAARMENSRDEVQINSLLTIKIPHELKRIELARKGALNQAGFCSTSALVNTYAQKVIGIADDTTAAINAINDRVISIHPVQPELH